MPRSFCRSGGGLLPFLASYDRFLPQTCSRIFPRQVRSALPQHSQSSNSISLIGSGDMASIGSGPGQFFTVDVPLKDGLTDKTFHRVFTRYVTDSLKWPYFREKGLGKYHAFWGKTDQK